MPKMTDDELKQLVLKRRSASAGKYSNAETTARLEAMQFYRGDNLDLYGDSGAGLSTVVSRDLMEAVESMLPGLVKPFVAGDETVRMEPRGPEDEDAAKQATEYLNWRFSRDNNSFRVIYDLMKDGLLSRLGVAKVVREEETEYEVETYAGLDEMQLQALVSDKSLEVIEPITLDPDSQTFEVQVKIAKPCSYYRVIVIAPDEFKYESRLVSLESASYLGHRTKKPVGDLIAMGLPADKCKKLQQATLDGIEETDRNEHDKYRIQYDDDDLARIVDVEEAYVRCDYDGSGGLSWRKVWMGGEAEEATMLDHEAVEDHPFVAWTPIPLPHKLVGMSMHDLTRDVQMQKTALTRELLNNMYLTNRPMKEIVEGQVNIEDILNPTVGGAVRVKQPGMIRDMVVPFVAKEAFPLIEYLDTVREQRTGSTRYNQGMDADSLNKTATGVTIIQNASMQRLELVARQFSECLREIFKKLLELVSLHQDKPEMIRLRGQWTEIDPREWKNGFDMSVVVGLGTGNKDQIVAHLTNLLAIDEQIVQLQQGANGPLLTFEGIYNKLKRLGEAMDLKGIEQYYQDPKQGQEQGGQPQQPQGPSPEQVQADAQAQSDQMKAQLEQQKNELHAQLEQFKAQLDHQTKIEVAKIAADAQIIVAGMQVPTGLDAGGANDEPAQEPSESDDGIHEPSYALGALHGAQAASGGPPEGEMPA